MLIGVSVFFFIQGVHGRQWTDFLVLFILSLLLVHCQTLSTHSLFPLLKTHWVGGRSVHNTTKLNGSSSMLALFSFFFNRYIRSCSTVTLLYFLKYTDSSLSITVSAYDVPRLKIGLQAILRDVKVGTS